MFVAIDTEQNVMMINKKGCEILGYEEHEIVGKNWFDHFIKTENIEDIKEVFNQIISGNIQPVEYYENPVFTKDGDEKIIAWHNSIIRDESGSIIGTLSSGDDITEHKRAEKVLRESEERFRMIFTNSTDGIIVADPATKKFTCVNPAICKALDYTEEELTQMSVVDIHPKNSLEHVVSEFEAQARGEKLLAMNIPFLKKDGTIIYMDISASMVKIGEKHRIMGIFRDITERKHAEEAIRKAHDELEHRVEDRTRKLRTTLKTMRRKEEEIIQHKSSLEKVNRELMETNQALSILARNIDRDKEFLEKKIYETTSVNIMPIIKELQKDTNCQKHQADLEVLTTYLNDLLISGPTDHHDIIISLTDQEMRVAVMIKNNLTSQKIANMLYISLHTVKTHRKNIRKKLNIQNSTVNLASYLQSKMVSDSM
jgi:PAS domain S-box-containing protein